MPVFCRDYFVVMFMCADLRVEELKTDEVSFHIYSHDREEPMCVKASTSMVIVHCVFDTYSCNIPKDGRTHMCVPMFLSAAFQDQASLCVCRVCFFVFLFMQV